MCSQIIFRKTVGGNVPEIISTLVDILTKEGDLTISELSKTIEESSNITNKSIIESGFKSLLERNIIVQRDASGESSITASDTEQPKMSVLTNPSGEQRFFLSSTFDKLDKNAPKIAQTILSLGFMSVRILLCIIALIIAYTNDCVIGAQITDQ